MNTIKEQSEKLQNRYIEKGKAYGQRLAWLEALDLSGLLTTSAIIKAQLVESKKNTDIELAFRTTVKQEQILKQAYKNLEFAYTLLGYQYTVAQLQILAEKYFRNHTSLDRAIAVELAEIAEQLEQRPLYTNELKVDMTEYNKVIEELQ